MASAQSEQSSFLQDELTCPVCLDLYRDPHLLPCGHNFCKNCLNRLRRQADQGRFRCPECRDSHRCGLNFQKNFKLANIADDYRHRRSATTAAAAASKSREPLSSSVSVQQGKSVSAVPCDYCPAAAEEASGPPPGRCFAVKTCLKCEVSMCQEHVKPHLELPAFREHPLTEPMNDLWKRKCPDHDEIYRYYCMDDKMCVCNACTIEGGHSGHKIKTLKNTMKDFKGTLDKQMHRVERKYSMAEKKLQEQKEKERQNKTFLDDSEQCLNRLVDEMKAKVLRFVTRLRECTQAHCDTNGPGIQKNISTICQDQARLQEVRCGLESLAHENDPFRFIQAYKTTGKQCRKQLRKNMFYPEYVDMETEVLGVMMQKEMRKFLNEELPCHIGAAINSLCCRLWRSNVTSGHLSVVEEEEEEEEENEEEAVDDDDDDDDSSVEEMRSEGEEEDEEEEEDDDEEEEEEEEEHDHSEAYSFSPGEEDEDEEEEDEEEEEEEEEEEDGVLDDTVAGEEEDEAEGVV
ncbi:E3 ubiquitin/ISG15 ligase TRIM25 [Pseudochaenichthys georgianus]|uniref:E3 ubiquitin/ISG15 ligase TRIM25 n=1 Tax=Pseudochaenichthys georgianus TaxID=52239 RepID=UPI001469DDBB|nr:E3 ubiquitin/ISG15 ligase TRIM25 [Pseudochaenichthys georgianus]